MKTNILIGLCMVLMLAICGTASAWLSGYDYRMQIDINNTGANLTDYQYNFTADTASLVSASKMNANGSDCRITNATDAHQSFWNETPFNGSSTKIWGNASYLGNVSNTTHYFYYGNSGASDVSDISATFDFGDSFSSGTLTQVNEPTNPTRIPDQTWEGTCLCEQSDFHYGGEYISWYRGHGSGTFQIGFENSTDGITWSPYPSNPILPDTSIAFPYIVQDGDCFYMFAKKPETDGKLYLYNVTANYTDPLIMNSGNPVLEISQAWEGSNIYNVGVDIVGDTWHMVYDAVTSPPYSMGYAYSNLTEMNWTIHKSVENPIITGDKANPYLKYVPDRNSLLMINTIKVGGTYEIGAHYASLSDNLSLDASWHLAPNFGISHAGVHATDPSAMWNFNTTHPTMISYNYNQAQTYQVYYAATLNEFFDSATTTPLTMWDTYGTFSHNINDGKIAITTTGTNWGILKSKKVLSMPHIVEWRGKAPTVNVYTRSGFSSDTTSTSTNQNIWWWGHWSGGVPAAQRGYCYLSGTPSYSEVSSILPSTTYENWEVKWINASSVKYYQNNTYQINVSSNIVTTDLSAWVVSGWGAGTNYIDWVFARQYAAIEPTSSLGSEESAPSVEYIPPTPTTLTNTTGNFWVNHTWSAGTGNVTDSYNVSQNTTWHNTTTPPHFNASSVGAHGYSDIVVFAFNSSGDGTLSATNVTQNTTVPNNAIIITNTSDWSGNAGNNVYVDYDATDSDGDVPTFSCNRTDLFTDFSTSTGKGNWTSVAGTYYVDFGVSDGYGSTDNYTMTISTSVVTISLHSVSPETIHTNYTGPIQVNYTVQSTNPLNLSTLAMLYGVNYTTTGDMHSYVASPPNSITSEGIYRAPNRNTTPYLSWENNATITDDNVWQWGGGDNDSWWITKTPINATHTWINATGIPEHVFQSSFYLKKTSMYSAPKTAFNINSQQGLIIKMWDNEAIRGRSVDYIMNMYFDSDWQSTIPTSPIEIWGFNSSFNPDTDDPATSEWGAKIVEWDGNRWANHSWVPGPNASYAYPLIFNASSFPVIPDEINYVYLKSGTQSSKSYVLNATNHDPGICNLTYAQTETMWTHNELADESTLVAYTPSFFTTFVRDDEEFLHHMYIADDQGAWAHSGINNISIGVSHFPVSASSFEYFNVTCPTLGYTLDTGMGSTYDNGYIHIGIYCHADPDGGTVSHNITLHYANETFAGVINDTFQTTSSGLYEINFTTTPYYSTTEAYILKCVSTDDEGSVATTWLDSFFTLAADGTQGYYVDDYLMFWGMNNIPTLYTSVANNSLISYDAGSDIYTMHVPFFKSKCNDTFRFNETVHLKSLNTEDVAYFRFGGETIFDNANIYGWNTFSDTPAPSTDAYRGYVYSCCRTTGNITDSDLSYLGSDVYRQEGINFIGNTMDYLIYNTTLSYNSRGIIMEECENFNISHCNIHDNEETGIGIYYSNSMVVENCTISDSYYDPGLYLYEASDNIIRYNTISDCVNYGMRARSNSNNNTLTSNNITGSGIYDYYFSSAAINNTIRDAASTTDKIRVTATSEVNIENMDNIAFTEDSLNSTYAYQTNFSMVVNNVSQTFDITQCNMTVVPSSDSIRVWNLVWDTSVSFNASNVSGSPHVWFNATQSIWANTNMTVYRNGSIYYNGTADANGLFAHNYSGGWSEHGFEFSPENIAPDKPTVIIPANGATGTSTNPTLRVQVTDPNDYDSLNVTFYAQGGTQIGSTQTGIANGSTASVVWSGRSYSTTYYWYAVVDDGTAQTQSDTWHFRTQGSGSGSSHVIAITGCTDWSGNAGNQVYIDFGCNGETAGATFTTNATNGSIDSSTGVYTWNTNAADAGMYTWRFNVENVYSVSDYCDVTITIYHYASPTNLAATTGNFWVNHTWDGNGFMDSYNVSVNDVWANGSANKYTYHVRFPHAWSNISVAAFNDTTGLSSFISNDVQVPNNAIVLTNYTTLMLATAGDNVSVDMNHEDLDGDPATYYCSRMDLFTDFNTADGTGKYTNAANGTHEVIFGVTGGYGWDNETITIEVGTVHPLELDEETPLTLFVVLVVLLFGSLFYIYHAVSYVAKIVTALISTWMSFMLSNMAVSGNVVLNYAELSAGDVFIYGAHSIQIAALSHFFMFTGVVSALFMLAFAIKLVIDTYLDMQEKRKADEEWDGVEQ